MTFFSRMPTWAWVTGLSILAGGLAGFMVAFGFFSPQLSSLETTMRRGLERAVSVEPEVRVVRVEREPTPVAIPDVFLHERRSPSVTFIKRPPRLPEAHTLLPDDAALGHGVAMTVDGWLVSPASIFTGLRVADLAVVWRGRVYTVDKVVKDGVTDLAYIKLAVTDFPAVSFIRAEEVVLGLPAWLEARPGRVDARTIVDVRGRFPRAVVRSERVTRRYLMSGVVPESTRGAPVWNQRGQLIGLADGHDGLTTRLLSVQSVSDSLSQLIATGEIRHASLGVTGVDGSLLVSETLPESTGFMIRADRGTRLPAIDPKGPAATLLKEDDVIERLDEDVLDGAADLGERLLAYKPNTRLTFYGQRAGAPFQVKITLPASVSSEVLK